MISSVTLGVATRFSTVIGDALVKLAAKKTARVVGRSMIILGCRSREILV